MTKETLKITGASVQDRSARTGDTPDLIYFDGYHSQQRLCEAIREGDYSFSDWVPEDIQASIHNQLSKLSGDDPRPTFPDVSPFNHRIETALNLNGHNGPPTLHGKPPKEFPVYLQGWHAAADIQDHYPGCDAICTTKDGRAVTEVKPRGISIKPVILIKDGKLQKV